jgi:hypothetical protein
VEREPLPDALRLEHEPGRQRDRVAALDRRDKVAAADTCGDAALELAEPWMPLPVVSAPAPAAFVTRILVDPLPPPVLLCTIAAIRMAEDAAIIGRADFRTWNGCQPGWTVQDGLCKPYRGF